jgi:tRNA 2-thiocytidine biosynthesis protein TtcA
MGVSLNISLSKLSVGKYMNNKFINTVNVRIGRTIVKQKLISEGDKVLVALSGGKDSMILLDVLSNRKRHFPFKFELVASHIFIKNMGYKTELDYLKKFCNEINVPLIIKEFDIDLSQNNKKSECFVCSWHRRKALFELTKELGCNKLAFGHHMNDAVETLFMNMIYHGAISAMPFSVDMLDGRIKLIRPLLEICEDELIEYARLKEYKKELKTCPFSNSNRQKIKELIKSTSEIRNVATKNIFRSMDNIYTEYLPHWMR